MTDNGRAPDYVCRSIECAHYKENSGEDYCGLTYCKYSPSEISGLLQIDTLSGFDKSQLESLATFSKIVQQNILAN